MKTLLMCMVFFIGTAQAADKALTYEEQILHDLRWICTHEATGDHCYEAEVQIHDIVDCGNDIHMREPNGGSGMMLLRRIGADSIVLRYGARNYFVIDPFFSVETLHVYPHDTNFDGFSDGAEDCITYIFDDP